MTLTQILLLICVCFCVPIASLILWVIRAVVRAFGAWALMHSIQVEHERMKEVRGRRVS